MQSFNILMKKISVLFLCFMAVQLQAQVIISGTLTTIEDEPMSNIAIDISDVGTVQTDAAGYYEIEVPNGYTGTISPISPLDYANGVTELDALIMRAMILGIFEPEFNYLLLAADINNTAGVTTLDLAQLRQLIEGVTTTLFNSPSWQFVDTDFAFETPLFPWQVPSFPVINVVDNLTEDYTLNFTGVKMGDLNGSSVSGFNTITGNIFNDDNENCVDDDGTPSVEGWSIDIDGSSASYQYLNENGNFIIVAETGDYTLTITPPNEYWILCQNEIPVTVGDDPVELSIGAQKVIDCPYMEVDLSVDFLRRCFDNNYFINYCNTGTAIAEDAYVTVHFDPFLNVQSTSVAPIAVDGNIYTFDLGDVDVGECGSILAVVEVSCDSELGQTHCSEANIFPDSLCIPTSALWSGADLELTGECIDEEVKFTIENIGDDMDEPVQYIIIEDLLVKISDQIQLNAGQKWEMQEPNNGTTCRLEVEQIANHPLGHQLMAFVEGCGTHPDGSISLGMITQFPFDGNKPFSDVDCQENRGSWDPNDITGYPLGRGENGLIDLGQELEYHIRFQNTGTDTAIHVRIENSLPEEMDWTTFRPLGASHDYTYNMENGAMVFYFTDIMLPDSNVNVAASNGYIRYAMQQRTDLEIGDIIHNQASIFFDFNEPVVTNMSTHTIGEDLMTVETKELFLSNFNLDFFPNPFDNQLTINLKTDNFQTATIEIFDAAGRLVQTETFNSRSLTFATEKLNEGFYFFHVSLNGKSAASGKIIKKE